MAAPNMNCRLHLTDVHQNSPASFQLTTSTRQLILTTFGIRFRVQLYPKKKFISLYSNMAAPNVNGRLHNNRCPPKTSSFFSTDRVQKCNSLPPEDPGLRRKVAIDDGLIIDNKKTWQWPVYTLPWEPDHRRSNTLTGVEFALHEFTYSSTHLSKFRQRMNSNSLIFSNFYERMNVSTHFLKICTLTETI